MNNPAFSVPAFGLVDTAFVKKAVGELPLEPPLIQTSNTTLQDALKNCVNTRVSSIIVVDEDDQFLGVAPLTHVLQNITPYDKSSFLKQIGCCVDANWPVLQRACFLEEAYDTLLKGNYSNIPVIDRNNNTVLGMLTSQRISLFLMESLTDDIMEVYYPD